MLRSKFKSAGGSRGRDPDNAQLALFLNNGSRFNTYYVNKRASEHWREGND